MSRKINYFFTVLLGMILASALVFTVAAVHHVTHDQEADVTRRVFAAGVEGIHDPAANMAPLAFGNLDMGITVALWLGLPHAQNRVGGRGMGQAKEQGGGQSRVKRVFHWVFPVVG